MQPASSTSSRRNDGEGVGNGPLFLMVKLLVSVAGDGFAHSPGEKVTLDKEFEKRLVESGQAEYVNASRAGNKSGRSTSKSG